MEATSLSSCPPRDEPEFTLKEWNLKARRISRESTTTMSRRFSGSYIRSFREEENARSFRSSITISSTVSSPGYHLKDEIDPSTYSFTTALKAIQARSGCVWECLSPEGFALNSKWSEAERYICNPLSGEFPMECLSSKTLSGRFSTLHSLIAGRITMSAPLVYSSNHPSRRFINFPPKRSPIAVKEEEQEEEKQNHKTHFPIIQEKKEFNKAKCKTRDVGTQSNPPDYSPSSSITSSSCQTFPTPNGQESRCCFEPEDGRDDPSSNLKCMEESVQVGVVKATKELEKDAKRRNQQEIQHQLQQQQQIQRNSNNDNNNKNNKTTATRVQLCSCTRSGGCLSLGSVLSRPRSLWTRKRRREKQLQQHTIITASKLSIISGMFGSPTDRAATTNPPPQASMDANYKEGVQGN